MDCDALSRRVHYLQTLIDHFWNKGRQDYLFELHERHKLINVIPDREIKLNEVVIGEETHVPNQGGKLSKWRSLLRPKMGLIVDVNYPWLVDKNITS